MNRLLITGTGSGCGKTTVTMGLLAALTARGLAVSSFKCGPDYIDPMFHREALGIPSYNLDPFFSDGEDLKRSFLRHAGRDISVMEGVMGYYDGIGTEGTCSTWDVARITGTPAVLVISARGMATSAGAVIAGFRDFRSASGISGVIFNGVPSSMLPMLSRIAQDQGVPCFGCLPRREDLSVGSRNLGLITSAEIEDIRSLIAQLGELVEQNLDIDGLLSLASQAPDLSVSGSEDELPRYPVRVAVAEDKAFCFRYQDNLELLESMGAELVHFSPMADRSLPENVHALYLCGGYPELHLQELSDNRPMRESIRTAVGNGLPTFAECGGFMYLHDDISGVPMCGVIKGSCIEKQRLQRFGYVSLTTDRDSVMGPAGSVIRAHEFHYYDSTSNGDGCTAEKASNHVSYPCCHIGESLFAGFPHLYLPSAPSFAGEFLRRAYAYASRI
ncbi:MAG: cobyrinate a,c-diamide synthase [Oscillospiraceae bacterium]|nr:cobyrinate a,c-diamide synthase [Oscillospiraceae bacterium]